MTKSEAIKKWQDIIIEVEEKKSEIDNILGAIRLINDQINNVLNDSNSKLESVGSVDSQIKEKSANVDQLIQELNQKKQEIESISAEINEKKLAIDTSKEDIENLKNQVEELLKLNKEQSEKVSDMLQKAAAGSLFKSFNLRKDELKSSSRIWAISTALTTFILIGIAYYIINLTKVDNFLSHIFFIKIAISFPIIYWLIFSTKQYLKNKRLEEEYAFKSTVSLSLEAYRDLIKKEANESTKDSVIPLITDAVKSIFTSPSEIISKNPHKEDGDFSEGFLEKLINLVTKIKS